MEWTGTSDVYEWMETGQILNTATQLPAGHTSVDGFFCPNIICGSYCARAVVLQFFFRTNSKKLLCSYENEIQRSILCRNDDPSITLPTNVYTQVSTVDGTLIRPSTSPATLPPISVVTQNFPESSVTLTRIPGCSYSLTDAHQLCTDSGSRLAELTTADDYVNLMSLYRPTNP